MEEYIYVITDTHTRVVKYISGDISIEELNKVNESLKNDNAQELFLTKIPVLKRNNKDYEGIQISVLFENGIPFGAYINSIYDAELNFARLAKHSDTNDVIYNIYHDMWNDV